MQIEVKPLIVQLGNIVGADFYQTLTTPVVQSSCDSISSKKYIIGVKDGNRNLHVLHISFYVCNLKFVINFKYTSVYRTSFWLIKTFALMCFKFLINEKMELMSINSVCVRFKESK